MHGKLLAIVAMLGVGCGAQALGQESGQIDALVEMLGDVSSQRRQEATLRLAQRGEKARPALERAARSLDVEVALRAEQLLRMLKVERLWLPTLFDPSERLEDGSAVAHGAGGAEGPNLLASSLLQQIAGQTGNRLLLGDSFGSFHDMPVELSCPELSGKAREAGVPFWLAVDAICRRSGNHIRPGYSKQDAGLVVVAGDHSACPVAYAGPVRGTITSVRRAYVEESEFQSGHVRVTHTFQLAVQLLWEDRLELVSYQNRPEVIEARSDRGDLMTMNQPSREGWSVVTPSRRQLTYQLRLDPPSWDARTLEVLRVRFGFVAVGEPRVALIKDLESRGVHQFEGVRVAVEKLGAKGPGWEVAVHVMPESILAMAPEALYYENRFEALDAQGRPMRLHETSHWLSEEGARFSLIFAKQKEQGPPEQLKITYPTIRSQRDLELAWHDVPLPASRGD